jgi:hypothetical protein
VGNDDFREVVSAGDGNSSSSGCDSMNAPGWHRRRSAAVTLTEETTRKGLRHRSLCLCPTRAATHLARSCSVVWRERERERERVETIKLDWIRRPTGEKEGERKGEKKKRKKKKGKKRKEEEKKLHRPMAPEGSENSVHWFKTKGNLVILSST